MDKSRTTINEIRTAMDKHGQESALLAEWLTDILAQAQAECRQESRELLAFLDSSEKNNDPNDDIEKAIDAIKHVQTLLSQTRKQLDSFGSAIKENNLYRKLVEYDKSLEAMISTLNHIDCLYDNLFNAASRQINSSGR